MTLHLIAFQDGDAKQTYIRKKFERGHKSHFPVTAKCSRILLPSEEMNTNYTTHPFFFDAFGCVPLNAHIARGIISSLSFIEY